MTRDDHRFRDLLGEAGDHDLAQLVADLDAAYSATKAPASLRSGRASTPRTERLPVPQLASGHRRFGRGVRRLPLLLAASLVVLLLLAGVARALEPLVDQVLSLSPGNGQIVSQHLGVVANSSSTVCGFSLSVDHLYADSTHVVVGYSLSAPPEGSFSDLAASLQLTDTQGNDLTDSDGQVMGDSQGSNSGNYLSVAVAGRIPRSGVLNLHVVAPSITAQQTFSGTPPAPVSCETYSATDDSLSPHQRRVTVQGPFTVTVSVPIDTRERVAIINQARTSLGNTRVTLERVVVTPTEARAYLRVQASAASGNSGPSTAIAPVLIVDGKEMNPVSTIGSANGESTATYDAALFTSQGTWALKVLTDPVSTNGNRAFTGSVIFPFTLP